MISLDSVLQPVATANGLANAHYTDPKTAEKEREKVFFSNWTAVGFGKDLAEPGSAVPIEFMGLPLLLVRDEDLTLRVFQNTCRHRGMILMDQPGKIKGVIRCPYHSWCYSKAGDLITTPHVGGPDINSAPEIKREELGLVEFNSHVWNDIIFVNISGNAPAFEDYAQDLQQRWHEFEQPLYHGGAGSSFKLEVQCNWKLAVENYCESYHLPWVHPGLNSYSRLEDHYNIVNPGRYSGQGTTVYNPGLDDSGHSFASFDNLSDKWHTTAEYVALYPNVLLGVHRDHTFAIILQPVDHQNTIEHIEIYYAKKSSITNNMADLRQKNAELWKGIFLEDIFVVEGMQKGRHGIRFDGGRFSPAMDEPTHAFHHWIATQFSR
jgi:phenylpropionate dioxygenase-like ring-hydroxylating dioxygenase large terminal subunit